MLPAKNFEKQGKIKLTIIKPNKYGFIEPDQVERELTSETCLVSVMLANNETGSFNYLFDNNSSNNQLLH